MKWERWEEIAARHPWASSPYPECGPGWYDIIDSLFIAIEDVLDESVHAYKNIDRLLRVGQIKEKFGGLRVHLDYGDDITDSEYARMEEAIEKAEGESIRTCENCGKPGRLRVDRGWMRTLCDECERK